MGIQETRSAYNPNLYQNVKYHGMCLYFEWISTSQETEPLSFLLRSFISLCLPMSVVKTPFFSFRYNYMCWAFCCFTRPGAMARCKASCTIIPLSPSPGQLSYCIGAISVPEGQREWSLPLKKGRFWRGDGETHPQKKAKPRPESGKVW